MCAERAQVWVDVQLTAAADDGAVVADLSFLVATASDDATSTCAVIARPRLSQSVEKLRSSVSFLRLATALYSALASAAIPKVNVIVAHPRCIDALLSEPGCTESRGNGAKNNTQGNEESSEYEVLDNGNGEVIASVPQGPGKESSIRVNGADRSLFSARVDSAGYIFGDGSGDDFFGRFSVVAVGGTFDRLHAGHRLLLTAAAWASSEKLWIGVTGEALLARKDHADLIAPFRERAKAASEFARQVRPDLGTIAVSELTDAAGATGRDPTIDAIVVSCETRSSADRINSARVQAGLPAMAVITVDILSGGPAKLSSSELREADARANRLEAGNEDLNGKGATIS